MAGLSHNPLAENCIKRSPDATPVEGETCALCAKKQAPAEEKVVQMPERPMAARFLERVGIVPGAELTDVRTVDGEIFAGLWEISDVAVLPEPFEAVITLRERGTAGGQRVVWSKVCSYTG